MEIVSFFDVFGKGNTKQQYGESFFFTLFHLVFGKAYQSLDTLFYVVTVT